MYLAADIGGTKTNIALQNQGDSQFHDLLSFPSKNSPNLEVIITQYLHQIKRETNHEITHACFAVAGPVEDGICRTTNLPWEVNATKISKQFSIPFVFLINDLESNAFAIEVLSQNQLKSLNPNASKLKGNRAVISPGTGLGEAGIYWDGKKYHPFASEGGHCDFGPTNEEQIRLCSFLFKRFGHASYERVLSGPGIKNLFDFYVEEEKLKPRFDLKVFKQNDPAVVISKHALEKSCDVSVKTLDLFTQLLGSESGNLALKMLSTGGVYIGGGIAPKTLPFLTKSLFLQAFINKGRFSSFLEKIPISVILDDKASLKGAFHFCHLISSK